MLTNEELQVGIVKELVKLREVGISTLDVLKPSGEVEIPSPLLDRAVDSFLRKRSGLTRSEAIAELLRGKTALLSNPEYREWISISLGVKAGLPTADPKELSVIASDAARHSSPGDFVRTGGRLQRAFHVLAAKIVADCLQPSEQDTSADVSESAMASSHPASQGETRIETTSNTDESWRPVRFRFPTAHQRHGRHRRVVSPSEARQPEPTTQKAEVKGKIRSRVDTASYVYRHDVHTEFKEAVKLGNRVIALVGYEGSGKTRTAVALTTSQENRLAASIEVRDGELQPYDLVSELLLHEVVDRRVFAKGMPTPVERAALFAALANSESAPEYIILDCSHSNTLPSGLENLTGARSRIVITCLPDFRLPGGTTVIEVGPLTETEALHLLRIGTMKDTEAFEYVGPGIGLNIIRELNGHPPAILYAARLVARSHMSAQDLLRTVRSNPEVFHYHMPDLPSRLQSTVRELLSSTDDRHRLQAHLLACMVLLERTSYVNRRFLETYTNFIGMRAPVVPVQLGRSSMSPDCDFAIDALVSQGFIVAGTEGRLKLRPTIGIVVRPLLRDYLWPVMRSTLAFCENTAVIIPLLHGHSFDVEAIREGGSNPGEVLWVLYHVFDILEEAVMSQPSSSANVTKNELMKAQNFRDRAMVVIKSQPDVHVDLYFKGFGDGTTWTYRG